MPDFILGMNAKIYYGFAAADIGDLEELTNAKDVTVNLERAEADITTRANSGWRATVSTLRDASVDFEMVWKPGDGGFDAIKDAYLDAYGVGEDEGTIELAILDGDKDIVGSQGLKATFSITSFSRSEPLEEALMVSVTAKLTTFGEWLVVV